MNKRIYKILSTSLLLVNLLPTSQALASNYNTNRTNNNYILVTEHKDKEKCNDEMDIKIVKKNIKFLSTEEQKEFEDICKCYKKNKSLTNEEKCKIRKYKQNILKAKLGDDYDEFIELMQKDKEKLTEKDKEKLREFFNKLK